MSPRGRIAVWSAAAFGAAAGLVFAVLLLLGAGLGADDARVAARIVEDRGPLLAFIALVVLIACVGVARAVHARFVGPLRSLAEQVSLIASANPAHRVEAAAHPEMSHLARAINRLGEAYSADRDTMEARAAESNARLEEERNRLAALMSELAEGVIVCNIQGRILLFNQQARALFEPPATPTLAATGSVGLGRTLFGFLDRDQVTHALDKIRYGLDRGATQPVTVLFAPGATGSLIRVRVAPFLASDGAIAGMVLSCEDVTRAIGREGERRALLQGLATRTRAPAASVRAAAENLAAYPDMDESQRQRFTHIIAAESRSLGDAIDAALSGYTDALGAGVCLEDMPLDDLVAVVRQRLGLPPGVALAGSGIDSALWVKVDSFAIAQAMAALGERLRGLATGEPCFRAERHGSFAAVDVLWRGPALGSAAFDDWETATVQVGSEPAPVAIRQVLERHGAEAWQQAHTGSGEAWVRFLIPLAEPAPAPRARAVIAPGSRPEFYDFDLFRIPDDARGLLAQELAELGCTVFDSETTGLQPSAGDRIVSIGAVRIVNGRVLKQESFEQLVDPERHLPRDSIRIHGIHPQALAGQPRLRDVLPAFHRFCADTVLVAHNAAFDMRFLELAEAESGVRFTQPVLDTLLLSAVTQPHLHDHSLEAIAERLGVAVVGRHTAMGDALMTAEIFLRLVPLLAANGIRTLGEALAASRETYYVRLQY